MAKRICWCRPGLACVSRRTGVWRSFSSNAAFDTKGKPGKTLPGFFFGGKQKTFADGSAAATRARTGPKVFWFFFSKKNCFSYRNQRKSWMPAYPDIPRLISVMFHEKWTGCEFLLNCLI
jgi:hypothetical protein